VCNKKLLIEGDANIVIESILGTQRFPLKILNIIQDCKTLFYDNNLEINTFHIYREANKTADYSTAIGHLIKEKKSLVLRFSMRFDEDLVVYALPRLCLS
jgi:hypothetical protein